MKYRSPPAVLVVQLNRYDPRNGRRRSDAPVPLEGELDLAEYVDAPRAPRTNRAPRDEPEFVGHADGPRASGTDRAPKGTRYRLRAVVNHAGRSVRDGHYTCWVRDRAPRAAPGVTAAEDGRDRGVWTPFDDSTVQKPRADLPAEVHHGAYLLFYEQVSAGPGGPGGAAAAAGPTDTGQDPRERSGGEDPSSPERVESAGEEHAPPRGCERAGGIAGPSLGARGERGAGPEPIWGGEIECDEEPNSPPGGPQTAADDDEETDVTMEDATGAEEDLDAIMQDSG